MKHNFNNLDIWKRSRQLAVSMYKITQTFPDTEKFGLTNQIRRCSVSIPSNIAEGCGRGTSAQLKHHLDVAIGSNCELETQVIISKDLGFIDDRVKESIVDEIIVIRKMILKFKSQL